MFYNELEILGNGAGNMSTENEKEARAKQAQENMEKVKESMAVQQQIAQGNSLQHSEAINFVSKEGNSYVGTIIFKKPSAMEMLKIGGQKSEYLRLGGAINVQLIDNSIRYLAHVMATLKIVVSKAPEWFTNIEKITDAEVIYYVYDLYDEWESRFRRASETPPASDSETTEGA